ncbi:MAG: MarR family winged helix-turn-helix transcriptional regulator [Cognatishimia sp.]
MKFQNIDSTTLPQSSSFLVKVLHRMSTLLAKSATIEFAEVTEFNIVEWRVVSGLYALGPSTQRTMVDYTGGDQAQTSRVLSSLVRQGMVRREANGSDGRARDFELTVAGLEAVQIAMPRIAGYFSQIDDALNEAEKELFVSFLDRLLNAANASESRRETATPGLNQPAS